MTRKVSSSTGSIAFDRKVSSGWLSAEKEVRRAQVLVALELAELAAHGGDAQVLDREPNRAWSLSIFQVPVAMPIRLSVLVVMSVRLSPRSFLGSERRRSPLHASTNGSVPFRHRVVENHAVRPDAGTEHFPDPGRQCRFRVKGGTRPRRLSRTRFGRVDLIPLTVAFAWQSRGVGRFHWRSSWSSPASGVRTSSRPLLSWGEGDAH
jgi:hypothetical protein